MSVGVAMVSCGGNKLVRALRSFRRAEPNTPIHIVLDVRSNNWKRDKSPSPEWLLDQPLTYVRTVESGGYINGNFNFAIAWMAELGHTHACVLQDDTIYSSLPENRNHISEWFERIETNEQLSWASALSLSFIEAIVPTGDPGCWHWPPERWDKEDIESEEFWRKLLPNGKARGYSCYDESTDCVGDEVRFPEWIARFSGLRQTGDYDRLGPVAFIIPIELWSKLGRFDETDGVFYDIDWIGASAQHGGLGRVLMIPNVPFLHLHCQTTWSGDPATGPWIDTLGAFQKKYGHEVAVALRKLGYNA